MRNLSLDMDINLGGDESSNEKSPSQKAIKTYVDNNVKDNIDELDDIDLTNLSDGQVLSYDSSSDKWINKNKSAVVIRKWSDK